MLSAKTILIACAVFLILGLVLILIDYLRIRRYQKRFKQNLFPEDSWISGYEPMQLLIWDPSAEFVAKFAVHLGLLKKKYATEQVKLLQLHARAYTAAKITPTEWPLDTPLPKDVKFTTAESQRPPQTINVSIERQIPGGYKTQIWFSSSNDLLDVRRPIAVIVFRFNQWKTVGWRDYAELFRPLLDVHDLHLGAEPVYRETTMAPRGGYFLRLSSLPKVQGLPIAEDGSEGHSETAAPKRQSDELYLRLDILEQS